MTDVQDVHALHTEPGPIERGRYAIFVTPDGGWAVARANGICETCQHCGCGEQQEPIPVPAMLVPFITGQAEVTKGGMMGMVKGLLNGK